jgi:hypothetical protein
MYIHTCSVPLRRSTVIDEAVVGQTCSVSNSLLNGSKLIQPCLPFQVWKLGRYRDFLTAPELPVPQISGETGSYLPVVARQVTKQAHK